MRFSFDQTSVLNIVCLIGIVGWLGSMGYAIVSAIDGIETDCHRNSHACGSLAKRELREEAPSHLERTIPANDGSGLTP